MISSLAKVSLNSEPVLVCESSQEYVKKERTARSVFQSELLRTLHTSSQTLRCFING